MTAQRIDPLVTIEPKPCYSEFIEAAVEFLAMDDMTVGNTAGRLRTVLNHADAWGFRLTDDQVLDIFDRGTDMLADRLTNRRHGHESRRRIGVPIFRAKQWIRRAHHPRVVRGDVAGGTTGKPKQR